MPSMRSMLKLSIFLLIHSSQSFFLSFKIFVLFGLFFAVAIALLGYIISYSLSLVDQLSFEYITLSSKTLFVTLLQISCVDVSNDTGKIAVAYENKVRYVQYYVLIVCTVFEMGLKTVSPCLTNECI
jgi:hypothetical protein